MPLIFLSQLHWLCLSLIMFLNIFTQSSFSTHLMVKSLDYKVNYFEVHIQIDFCNEIHCMSRMDPSFLYPHFILDIGTMYSMMLQADQFGDRSLCHSTQCFWNVKKLKKHLKHLLNIRCWALSRGKSVGGFFTSYCGTGDKDILIWQKVWLVPQFLKENESFQGSPTKHSRLYSGISTLWDSNPLVSKRENAHHN